MRPATPALGPGSGNTPADASHRTRPCGESLPRGDTDGRLTVLAGPTAVGKGTVAEYVRAHYPQVWHSVSVTTRAPRPGERDGAHYHFVAGEEFARMRDAGDLLEWAVVHGHASYGTPREPVRRALADGRLALLEIDLQGARQVRAGMPEALFVFLAPPSWDELVARLMGRGTETPAEREARLATAREELAAAEEFDAVVVNDRVERAAAELVSLMTACRSAPTATTSHHSLET